ncbi:MAG: HU family DNA-binding protein [Tannerella sp.]|nr:HU family DNA-binding protein [Tannerella sp.]
MNERFTTRNLAEILAVQTGMDKERAEKFIDVLSSYIAQGIERNKLVKVIGLGTFKVVLVRERESVHIHTGERFVIPTHHKISYIPDKELKEQINRPFAYFEPIEASEDILSLIKQTGENATEKDVKSEVSYDATELETIYDNTETEAIHGDTAELEIVHDNIESEEKSVIVYDNDEELFDTTENTAEDTVHIYSDENREYDYLSRITDDYPVIEEAEEEFFDPEPATNGEEVDTISVDVKDGDLAYINTGLKNEEERDETTIYNRPQVGNKKVIKTVAPLWLWFLLLPFLIVAGVGIAAYAFLYFNTNVSSESISPSVNKTATVDITPLPIGEVLMTDTDRSTEPENEITPRQVNGENIASADIAENSNANKKEEKRVIDWFSQTPETADPKPEQAGNERKNEIAATNTAATTPESGQIEQRNDNRTTDAATNKPQNTPAEKIVPARVRMTAGSSLTQLAMEYYGDKVFWVYIYEHNKSRIKDFNNIPVGMEIYLPRPNTYGINAKNRVSVQKARQKQSELLKWDKWDDYK